MSPKPKLAPSYIERSGSTSSLVNGVVSEVRFGPTLPVCRAGSTDATASKALNRQRFPGEMMCLAVLGQTLSRVVSRRSNPSERFNFCLQCKSGSAQCSVDPVNPPDANQALTPIRIRGLVFLALWTRGSPSRFNEHHSFYFCPDSRLFCRLWSSKEWDSAKRRPRSVFARGRAPDDLCYLRWPRAF